jgi:hypothetical protein
MYLDTFLTDNDQSLMLRVTEPSGTSFWYGENGAHHEADFTQHHPLAAGAPGTTREWLKGGEVDAKVHDMAVQAIKGVASGAQPPATTSLVGRLVALHQGAISAGNSLP